MHKKIMISMLLMTLPDLVFATNNNDHLLKLVNSKIYEGVVQFAPQETRTVNLDITFSSPNDENDQMDSGAMVGLIQVKGEAPGLRLRFSRACSGSIGMKVGIKEITTGRYAYHESKWNVNRIERKISLDTAYYKGMDDIERYPVTPLTSALTSRSDYEATFGFPQSIPYGYGSVLVVEKVSYQSKVSRVASPCSVNISQL